MKNSNVTNIPGIKTPLGPVSEYNSENIKKRSGLPFIVKVTPADVISNAFKIKFSHLMDDEFYRLSHTKYDKYNAELNLTIPELGSSYPTQFTLGQDADTINGSIDPDLLYPWIPTSDEGQQHNYSAYTQLHQAAVSSFTQLLSGLYTETTEDMVIEVATSGADSVAHPLDLIVPVERDVFVLDSNFVIKKDGSNVPVRLPIARVSGTLTIATPPDQTEIFTVDFTNYSVTEDIYIVFGVYGTWNDFIVDYHPYSNLMWSILHGGSGGSAGLDPETGLPAFPDPVANPDGNSDNSYSSFYETTPGFIGNTRVAEIYGFGGNMVPIAYLTGNADPYVDNEVLAGQIMGIIPFGIYTVDALNAKVKAGGANRFLNHPDTEGKLRDTERLIHMSIPLITDSELINISAPEDGRQLKAITQADWGASASIGNFQDPQFTDPGRYPYYLVPHSTSATTLGYNTLVSNNLSVLQLSRRTYIASDLTDGLIYPDPIVPIHMFYADPNKPPHIEVIVAGRIARKQTKRRNTPISRAKLAEQLTRNSEPLEDANGFVIPEANKDWVENNIRNKRSLPDPLSSNPLANPIVGAYGIGDYTVRRMLVFLKPSSINASSVTLGFTPKEVLVDGLVVLWTNREHSLSDVTYEIAAYLG